MKIWPPIWLLPAGAERLENWGFEWGTGVPFWIAALLVAVVLCAGWGYAYSHNRRGSPASRIILSSLRAVALVLVLALVLDPVLVAHQVVPSEQTVAILIDDSKSMQIRNGDNPSRGESVKQSLSRTDGEFLRRLRERFQVALYGFGEDAYRISDPGALTSNARESRISRAVRQVASGARGESLAGIVIISDGVEQGEPEAPDPDWAARLHVPVFTVAPPQSDWHDVGIGSFAVPRRSFADAPVTLDVPVTADGMKGREVTIDLYKLGEGPQKPARLEASQTFSPETDSVERRVRFEIRPEEKTWTSWRIGVRNSREAGPGSTSGKASEPGSGDDVPQNDSRAFELDLRPKDYRILYFSGRPNWENAFIRRELSDDPELDLTTHIRISEAEKKFVFRGKKSSMSNRLFEGFEGEGMEAPRYDESVFLRFGRKVDPLSDGYPIRAEDLFAYDLILWSDIEYEFFNQEQIELTRDFVRKRGGTLLLMGGPRAFAEGHFAGTTIEGMMPALLERESSAALSQTGNPLPETWAVEPTLEGQISGLFALDPSPDANRRLWEEMPRISGVNAFISTRPGATVSAEAVHGNRKAPLYLVHRYGEGRCAALATGTTWLWKMEREPDDTSHRRIWAQLLRDLAKDSPRPIVLNSRRDIYPSGVEQPLEFLIRDAVYDPRESLQVELTVTEPNGEERQLPVDESLDQSGIYTGSWKPAEEGEHVVNLSAKTERGEFVGDFEDRLQVSADLGEFQRARIDEGYLKEIADASGGAMVPLADLGSLIERIPWTPPSSQKAFRFHLWHLPPFYVLLVCLLALEWWMRRRRGLA